MLFCHFVIVTFVYLVHFAYVSFALRKIGFACKHNYPASIRSVMKKTCSYLLRSEEKIFIFSRRIYEEAEQPRVVAT